MCFYTGIEMLCYDVNNYGKNVDFQVNVQNFSEKSIQGYCTLLLLFRSIPY